MEWLLAPKVLPFAQHPTHNIYLLRCCPAQAGQLLLFLQQDLQLPIELITKQCLRWAAALQPGTTQASMAAVATCLQHQLNLDQQQLLTVLQQFPEILGRDVEADLLPKFAFFQSLGPRGEKVLDTLYDSDTGWLQVCGSDL